MKNLKEEFLKCFEEGAEKKAFLELMSKYAKKEICADLEQAVSTLTTNELDSCWAKLANFVPNILAALSQGETDNEEVKLNEEYIVGVACLATIVINNAPSISKRVPAGLLELAGLLNELITCNLNPFLTHDLVKLCELWWKKELPQRKKHCASAFYHLLTKSLKKDAKKSDVKRVWSMHNVLDIVTVDAPLKSLLLKAAKNPNYIKCDEGVKFIGFTFSLSDQLAVALHYEIKLRMVTENIYQAKRYGRVYLEAFPAIPNQNRQVFEEECLQDMLFLGVHVKSDRDPKFAKSLHSFLHVIHAQKKTNKDVGALLYKLYEPFLWKCLSVPNCVVRSNAVAILLDLFPWENPSADIVENDSIFNKQINLFEDMLVDPVSIVRQRAITGVCKVLSLYWELFPTRSIQKYMEIFTGKSLLDATSSEVRYTTVIGFLKLLEQRLAHPTLKVVLQKWGGAFNDVNVKVRSAMADLLFKVKFIKSIKYWEIVPIDDIVARLARDETFVSAKLTKLVFNSYHPQNQADEVLLDRTLSLVKLNPTAAKRMYMLSSDLLEIGKGVKFIIIIIKAVKLQYKRHSKRTLSSDNEGGTPRKARKLMTHDGSLYESENESGKENQENDADGGSRGELDKEAMAALLEIAAILFRLYQKQLREERYAGFLQLLSRVCSKVLPKMLAFYKNYPELSKAIIYLASYVPSGCMSTMVGFCKSRLRTVTLPSEYELLLDCLINWRRGDDILELVTEWLEAGMKISNQNTSRRSIARGVKFIMPTTPTPDMGIVFMTYCLSHNFNKTVLLEKNRDDMVLLLKSLDAVTDLIEKRFVNREQLNDHCTDIFLHDALLFYLKLAAVLHKEAVFDATQYIGNVVDTLDRQLIRVLENVDGEYSEDDMKLSVQLMDCLLNFSCQLSLIGLSNKDFNLKAISLSQRALRTNRAVEFTTASSRLLFQIADFCYSHERNVQTDLLEGALVNLFNDVLKYIAAVTEFTGMEMIVRQCIQETLVIYSNIYNQQLLSNMCQLLVTTALGCQINSENLVEDLCDNSACLVMAAAYRVEPLRIVVELLCDMVEAGALKTEEELLAALHILATVTRKKNKLNSKYLTALLEALDRARSSVAERENKPENLEALQSKSTDLVDMLKKRLGLMAPSG